MSAIISAGSTVYKGDRDQWISPIRSEPCGAANERSAPVWRRGLGIGIDEDTAIIVENGAFKVIGSGAVYVVDGADVTHSNVAEARPEKPLSIFGVRMHVIAANNHFDLERLVPSING